MMAARERYAARGHRRRMDFAYTPREEAFRRELREWLRVNLAAHRTRFPPSDDELVLHPDKSFDSSLAWHRRMHAGGWVGIDWPREYGGRGAGPVERLILTEELVASGAPPGVNVIGLGMVGPAVMHHGTPEQKGRWIRPILSADEIWCQGFSEPGAGSDLANLSTRAALDGDAFVVNGQKVWTSNAHRSHYCILLVRTNADAPKHKGLSCLLVDMKSPGITIRPLLQLTGDAEFNEVFFDQVRVPRENLLGRIDGGWEVAITVLMYERLAVGSLVILHHMIERVLDLARRWPAGRAPAARPAGASPAGSGGGADGDSGRGSRAADDAVLRQRLAELYIGGRAVRLTGLRYLTRHLGGATPGAEGSVLKVTMTDAYRDLAEIAAEIIGSYHQLWGDQALAPDAGRWAFQALFAHRFGIAGGTDQIQLNIIGERLLGLPRS
jgi:alkylation response protein AidB-like acyl-CoA dehydrogenase